MKSINKAVEISAPTMRNVLKRNSMRFAAALLVALASFVAAPNDALAASPQHQVTLNAGRTVDQKRAFYKAIEDGLHERLSLRREDVFISLVEVSKENWSFGNGEAQYAK